MVFISSIKLQFKQTYGFKLISEKNILQETICTEENYKKKKQI